MATPPLLTGADLAAFAGAPYTDAQASQAGEEIRAEAGWHIAPSVTETITVDSDGGPWLILDTLQLTDVTAVRDVTDPANPITLVDWSAAKTRRFRAGCLIRRSGWPRGVLEVDIVHGYDACPGELRKAAAALARETRGQGSGGSVRLGSLSLVLPDSTETVGSAVDRYKIPPRP